MASQIYFANTDWPANNVRVWWQETLIPSQPELSQWQWMMFDVDFGFGLRGYPGFPANASQNTLRWATDQFSPRWPNREVEWPNALFRGLLANESFREEFIRTVHELLDTRFSAENVKKHLRAAKADILH